MSSSFTAAAGGDSRFTTLAASKQGTSAFHMMSKVAIAPQGQLLKDAAFDVQHCSHAELKVLHGADARDSMLAIVSSSDAPQQTMAT